VQALGTAASPGPSRWGCGRPQQVGWSAPGLPCCWATAGPPTGLERHSLQFPGPSCTPWVPQELVQALGPAAGPGPSRWVCGRQGMPGWADPCCLTHAPGAATKVSTMAAWGPSLPSRLCRGVAQGVVIARGLAAVQLLQQVAAPRGCCCRQHCCRWGAFGNVYWQLKWIAN
jgi:hypothetical protein